MDLNAIAKEWSSRTLFYPCSGKDVDAPIDTFAPHINEFWFVDEAYSAKRIPKPNESRYRQDSYSEFVLTGQTIRKKTSYEINVVSVVYTSLEHHWQITVNACRGRGYDTFNRFFRITGRKISVFFHRGDSQGEGGSDFYWLSHYPHPRGKGRGVFSYVLDSIESDGLIVTDGSNSMPEFAKFHNRFDVGAQCIEQCQTFEHKGRQFKCIGYIGRRNGPTLVWTTCPIVSSRP